MEDVIFAFIPIIAITGFFAWLLAISPVGKAYAERVRRAGEPAASGERDETLLAGLDDVRREVAELAERVEFMERLLARTREGQRIGAPAETPGAAGRKETR